MIVSCRRAAKRLAPLSPRGRRGGGGARAFPSPPTLSPAGRGEKRLGEHLAEFLQGAAHLGLDGTHGAVVHLGDLLVGEVAVLAEKEDLLLFRAETQKGLAEPL